MRHYTTLFDINYASKGLALLSSLHKHSSEPFTLHILPMDYQTWKFLTNQNQESIIMGTEVENFHTFFTPELNKLTNDGREWAGFCWTMASWYTDYVMKKVNDTVTYLDSDVFFFHNPEIMFNIMKKHETVAVVDHNFPDHDYDRLIGNGRFNVSIVTFKNDPYARMLLERWKNQCINKCDKTNCGDQKYLNEWPSQVGQDLLIHDGISIGPGPWNAYTYSFRKEGNGVMVRPPGGMEKRLIAYHYHETHKSPIDGTYTLTGYPTTEDQRKLIYDPYISTLKFFQHVIDKRNEVNSA